MRTRIALTLLSGLLLAAPAAAGGFEVVPTDDGPIWIFAKDSEPWEAWKTKGELPEKHVTQFVSTMAGVSILKSPDKDTLGAFRHHRPGFETRVVDGTVWVFPEGEAVEELPEKHVTILEAESGAVTTFKSPDSNTLKGYRHSRPGFTAVEDDGYSWIFAAGSPELEHARAGHLPEKHVTRLVAEEGLVTVYKSPDTLTLSTYLDVVLHQGRPGYTARLRDGNLWIFEENSPEQMQADLGHFPEKHVTTMRAEPSGVVVYKSPSKLTIKGFSAARPGHVVRPTEDGPVWVFLPSTPELMAFDAGERSEKHATRIVSTEGGVLTLKSDSVDVLRGYTASRPGFVGRVHDGNVWVFRMGSPELAEFDSGTELEKHVTSIVNVNGDVQTIKAPDMATLNAYRAESGTPMS